MTNDDLDEALAIHAADERKFVQDIIDRAFPDGPDAHGEYHRGLIKAAQAQEEFWRAAKLKLLDHGITGILWVIVFVLGLALLGVFSKFGIAVPLTGVK